VLQGGQGASFFVRDAHMKTSISLIPGRRIGQFIIKESRVISMSSIIPSLARTAECQLILLCLSLAMRMGGPKRASGI
jgi:hypothetical protein